jgi:hypothetical protein
VIRWLRALAYCAAVSGVVMLAWAHLQYASYPHYDATTLSVPLMIPSALSIMIFGYSAAKAEERWTPLFRRFVPARVWWAGVALVGVGVVEVIMVAAHLERNPFVIARTAEEARAFLSAGGCVHYPRSYGSRTTRRNRRIVSITIDATTCANIEWRSAHAFIGLLVFVSGLGVLTSSALHGIGGRLGQRGT